MNSIDLEVQRMVLRQAFPKRLVEAGAEPSIRWLEGQAWASVLQGFCAQIKDQDRPFGNQTWKT